MAILSKQLMTDTFYSVCLYSSRDTTLMPNIHGLMSIVALIFAPYAELR